MSNASASSALWGQLDARTEAMTLDPTTGLITVPIPTEVEQSQDIAVLDRHIIDRQRKVVRRLMKSQSNGLFASQVIRISDCADPTDEGYLYRPDIVEVTTSLTRDHLRSISASELASSCRFMESKPPGFPVHGTSFCWGTFMHAKVWL